MRRCCTMQLCAVSNSPWDASARQIPPHQLRPTVSDHRAPAETDSIKADCRHWLAVLSHQVGSLTGGARQSTALSIGLLTTPTALHTLADMLKTACRRQPMAHAALRKRVPT
jgi:hypothetical protein